MLRVPPRAEIWSAAIVAAGVVAGGAISASGANSAANTAANANAANVASTNQTNLDLFNASRGAINPATGTANSILPDYFGNNESTMANDAFSQYQNLLASGQGVQGQIQGNVNSLNPSLNQNLQQIANIYNGQALNAQLGYAAPTYAANLNLAQTTGQGYQQIAAANSNAIGTGLSSTLNQINAQNAAKGFLGGSSFNNNRLAGATIGAQQQAAVGTAQANAQAGQLMSQAQYANSLDTRQLQQQNLSAQQNGAALSSGLTNAASIYSLPSQASANIYTNAQSPLNFFKINPQSTSVQNAPTVYPTLSNGQIGGQALSSLAGSPAASSLLGSLFGSSSSGGQNAYQNNQAGYTAFMNAQG